MSDLTAVSLFDGIGGFPEALRRVGIRTVTTVEIDKAAAGVTADHFPEIQQFDDVTEVKADDLRAAGFVPERGILTGGWPCQDLSLAGRRLGLGGARSGLFFEVVRLARDLRPRWLVLENVPGLLSAVCSCPGLGVCGAGCVDPHPVRGGLCGSRGGSGGRCMDLHGGAMGAVLGSLGELGYGLAYRVLDAQHFGVPQRRRRVVIVGCLGDGAAPAQVLLEPESMCGDPAPGGEARQIVTALTRNGVGAGGGANGNSAQGGHLISTTLTAREGKGPDSDVTNGNLIAHALTAEGADASEDGTGRGTPLVGFDLAQITSATNRSNPRDGDPQPPIASSGRPHMASDIVRRLTPVECERLQGFPDNWTATSNSRPQADAPRYRQLGNSIAVPVFQWVARRIVAHESESGTCDT